MVKFAYSDSVLTERKQAQKGQKCCYCRREMTGAGTPENVPDREATIEHKVCRAMGGTNESHNLLWACARCNGLRGVVPYEAFSLFARIVIRQYPDAPVFVLRNALQQFLLHLVEVALCKPKEVKRAASLALLRLGEDQKDRGMS